MGTKQLGREVDQSPPSSADVQNENGPIFTPTAFTPVKETNLPVLRLMCVIVFNV